MLDTAPIEAPPAPVPEVAPEPAHPRTVPESVAIAVIGGGLRGLTCARALLRAGRDAHIFESGAELGGSLRSIVHPEGFRLDPGFHILFPDEPSVRQELDLESLDIRYLDPGCVLERNGHLHEFPLPSPSFSRARAARSPFASIRDAMKLASLRRPPEGETRPTDHAPDCSVMDFLRARGFSQDLIESFFVPYLGAFFHDRTLSFSTRHWESAIQGCLYARAAIPNEGIGAVVHQIAGEIPVDRMHTDSPVESLSVEGGRVRGLTVRGQTVRAEAIVLAVGPAETGRLSMSPQPDWKLLGTTVVYFTSTEIPTSEKRIFFRGDPDGWTSQFCVVTNIAPRRAPPGRHLLAGTILGIPEMPEGAISEKIRTEMAWWFPHGLTHLWRWLKTFKIPSARCAVLPGRFDPRPRVETEIKGLYIASDLMHPLKVEGALAAGRAAAQAVLEARA